MLTLSTIEFILIIGVIIMLLSVIGIAIEAIEFILIIGVIIMLLSVIGIAIEAILFSIRGKKLKKQLEKEYGSAAEMLQAFLDIYKNDPRTVRYKRRMRNVFALLAALFLAGGCMSFIGIQQIQNGQREYQEFIMS